MSCSVLCAWDAMPSGRIAAEEKAMLTVFIRSVILFAAAVTSMRLMGKRQVGQLQPYEMVVVIMIAEMAATPIDDADTPLLYGLLPMAALIVCHGIMTAVCMRSERIRGVICGKPTVLIRNGVICEKQMRKQSMTLSDLMEALRSGGILDPSEVGTAVLETAGHVTVFPKSRFRPVTPQDMQLKPPPEGLPLPLILDGRIQSGNLQRGGLSREWLHRQVRELGFADEEKILFMCLNTGGQLLCQGKGSEKTLLRQVMTEKQAGW